MDKYRIDSQKIQYHPQRISQWLNDANDWERAKKIYPIYVEISPAGACNHRCTFCAVDYIGYQVKFLDTQLLKDRLSEMAAKGVLSVMFAGEGEPLLHRGIGEIVVHARKAGIHCSFTTNAVALNEKLIEEALPSISWIKASINAGTSETYAKVHRTKPQDFEKTLANLTRAVEYKRKHDLSVVLGAQMVLLPENEGEAVTLAKRGKEIGLDYVVIKPYSQHKMSLTHEYEQVRYKSAQILAEKLEALNGGGFNVIFRTHTMAKWDDPDRHYTTCYATPYFWAYLMASGDLYGCSAYLLDERFNYGNINHQTFTEIWEGPQRQKNWSYVRNELDISECRKNCRMDEVNRYLWDLKHPPEHVNFI